MEATTEWLSSESLQYIAECLEACEDAQMLAELRAIFPKEALRSASRHVTPVQRDNLRKWLDQLNQRQSAVTQSEIPAKIYFDGGCRGNPGIGAGAAVVQWNGRTYSCAKYLRQTTSNEAEYTGLILGLQKAQELGVQEAQIYGDSQLVVNQVKGHWKVQKSQLRTFVDLARNLLSEFRSYEIAWIPRQDNKQADGVASQCIEDNKRAIA